MGVSLDYHETERSLHAILPPTSSAERWLAYRWLPQDAVWDGEVK